MITMKPGSFFHEFYGLSNDVKPTNDVPNASTFTEIDTGDIYAFDRDSLTWNKIGNTGGGGGGSAIPTEAEVTEILNEMLNVDTDGYLYTVLDAAVSASGPVPVIIQAPDKTLCSGSVGYDTETMVARFITYSKGYGVGAIFDRDDDIGWRLGEVSVWTM